MIFFGLDIGSGGCKCVAFNEDGTHLFTGYNEYKAVAGHSDMNADEMFASVCDVIKQCTSHLGKSAADVAAIAVTSFGESFVPVDINGNCLSDIIMYTDKRGLAETEELIGKVGYDKIMEITCVKPDAMYSLPKIMWTMNNISGVKDKVYKYLLMADFIAFKLSGEAKINYSLACRTMAFDLENRKWSDELLDAAGITRDKLSDPVLCGSIIGDITKSIAEQLGLPYTTKIMVSSHDQISAAVGAGVLDVGEAIDGTGSVECITPVFDGIMRDKDFTSHNFVCVPHAQTGLYSTYAFNFSGGVLLKWFRDCFASHMKADGINVYRMLDEMCPETPTDILVVPHFMGAGGTPDMVINAKGTITGLTMSSTLNDIYRAVMEGLSYEMLYNIESLTTYGININSLRATGGGAKSPLWLQMKADIFGTPITSVRTDEAGAAGCAMHAAVGMGVYKDFREAVSMFVNIGETYVPSDKYRDIYAEKYDRYKTVRNSLLHI